MKISKNIKLNTPAVIVLAAIVSSSCGMLGGAMGGMKLAMTESLDLSSASDQPVPVILSSSSPGLPQVRGDALYGIWAVE